MAKRSASRANVCVSTSVDGTFTVEAAPETQPLETGFRGVPWQQGVHVQPATYAVPMMPVQRIRQAPQVYVGPEAEQYKPEE